MFIFSLNLIMFWCKFSHILLLENHQVLSWFACKDCYYMYVLFGFSTCGKCLRRQDYKKQRTKTTRNWKKKHTKQKCRDPTLCIFPTSGMQCMQSVLFFWFYPLLLVMFFLFGVLHATNMKGNAKARLQTANKKQTRTLRCSPSVLLTARHVFCVICMLTVHAKTKPGSWQMTTLLVKLRNAHPHPKDNSSKNVVSFLTPEMWL